MMSKYAHRYTAWLSNNYCRVRLSSRLTESSGIESVYIVLANGDIESLRWHFEMWLWDNFQIDTVPDDPQGLLLDVVLAHYHWQIRGDEEKLEYLWKNHRDRTGDTSHRLEYLWLKQRNRA